MKQRVIGFDLRCVPRVVRDTKWGPQGRARFLLDTKVPVPLSIDTAWWPSRFVTPERRTKVYAAADPIVIQPSPDTAYFEAFDLWPLMGWVVHHHQPTSFGDVAIAVTMLDRPDGAVRTPDDRWLVALRAAADPQVVIEPNWEPLGFDVADSAYFSALTNFARPRERQDELAALWAGKLNPHGLFVEPDAALEFAAFADREHPDHRPFYAFGLWCVWGSEHLRP